MNISRRPLLLLRAPDGKHLPGASCVRWAFEWGAHWYRWYIYPDVREEA